MNLRKVTNKIKITNESYLKNFMKMYNFNFCTIPDDQIKIKDLKLSGLKIQLKYDEILCIKIINLLNRNYNYNSCEDQSCNDCIFNNKNAIEHLIKIKERNIDE